MKDIIYTTILFQASADSRLDLVLEQEVEHYGSYNQSLHNTYSCYTQAHCSEATHNDQENKTDPLLLSQCLCISIRLRTNPYSLMTS